MDLSKLSDQDLQAVSEGRMKDVSDEGIGMLSEPTTKEKALNIAEHAIKPLDYMGGAVRTGVANMLGVSKPGETADAFDPFSKNTAPSSSEIMKRMGVPEGAKVSDYLSGYAEPGQGKWYQPEKGGMLDPSVRGTIGTGLDVVSDPLTWLTGGASTGAEKALASEAALASSRGTLNRSWSDWLKSLGTSMKSASNPLVRPVSNAMDYAGGKMYRSALRPLDQEMVQSGKPLLSSRLMKDNVTGGWQSIDQHMLDKSGVLKQQALDLAGEMDKLDPVTRVNAEISQYGHELRPESVSGGIDMNAAMDKGRQSAQKLSDRPVMGGVQDTVNDLIEQHAAQGNVPRSRAIQMKSDLYSSVPDSAFDMAVRTEPGAGVRTQMARGIKEAVERGGTPELESLGKRLGGVNEEWGQYLTGKDKAGVLAQREMNKPAISQVDAMLAGGAFGEPNTMGGALGIKKGLQIGRSVPFKTGMGWGLQKAADLGLGRANFGNILDSTLRQKIIDDTNRAQSPWATMNSSQLGGR